MKVVSQMTRGFHDKLFVSCRFGHVESVCEAGGFYVATKEIQSRPLALVLLYFCVM